MKKQDNHNIQEKDLTLNETLYRCNVCGRNLKEENGILKEDMFEAVKEWGFFSKKDLEVHHFYICEECYDRMIKDFVIPVRKSDKKEILS